MRKVLRNVKKSTKQYITVCIISFLASSIMISGIGYKYVSGVTENYKNKEQGYLKEISDNQRTVYQATREIKAGEVLTEDSIELQDNVYASQPRELYISMSDIGKVVLIDIAQGTQLLKSMVTDTSVDDDIREVEFNTILISTNMLENDVIDVRIAYPNGEDYDVLAKKVLKGYTGEATNCFFWLTEEEIIRMHNAIVDAYLYTGAYLYTTKYIEPSLQEATIVNYTPSVEAINLIKENPNIIAMATNALSEDVRKALENRLAESMNKDITSQQWNLDNNYIYPDKEMVPTVPADADNAATDTEISIPSESEPEDSSSSSDIDSSLEIPDQQEFPETGDSDSGNNINGNDADLGRNNEEQNEDGSDDNNYEENYFITEG